MVITSISRQSENESATSRSRRLLTMRVYRKEMRADREEIFVICILNFRADILNAVESYFSGGICPDATLEI